jgi:anti-sigma factor RsiW
MLIPNHPHDEQLASLASGDPDALADAALTEHLASCERCTDIVAELGALRASLAELPDLRPHRPLQLLPPVEDAPSRVDVLGGWARRFFAPMLTAGAALAIVGLVGTTGPLIGGADSAAGLGETFQNIGSELSGDGGAAAASHESDMGLGATEADATDDRAMAAQPDATERAATDDEGAESQRPSPTEERSIWPMLLFAGVAIMIAAALLRWILAPRAG